MEKPLRIVSRKLSVNDVISIIRNDSSVDPDRLMQESGLTSPEINELLAKYGGPRLKPQKTRKPREPKERKQQPKKVENTGPIVRGLYAAGVALVGLILGLVGLGLNYQYTRSLCQTEWASQLLGYLGAGIDGGMMFLPTAFVILIEKRRFGQTAICGLIIVLCLALSMLAGISFNASNIGDTFQGRQTEVEHRKALALELDLARNERARVTEDRDPQELEQAIKNEEGQPRWISSKGCTLITTSASFCDNLFQLRASKRAAERRIELDSKLRSLNEQIAALAPIAAQDPGADVISWASAGSVNLTVTQNVRVIGLSLMPTLAGFLLAFARTLWKA